MFNELRSSELSYVEVSPKSFDFMRNFVQQKQKENLEMSITAKDKILCVKAFECGEEIRQEGYDYNSVSSLYSKITEIKQRADTVFNETFNEITAFNEGRYGNGRNQMLEKERYLENACLAVKKATDEALECNRRMFARSQKVLNYITTNKLQAMREECRRVRSTQVMIDEYMNSWQIAKGDTPMKKGLIEKILGGSLPIPKRPTEGEALINQLAGDINQLRVILNICGSTVGHQASMDKELYRLLNEEFLSSAEEKEYLAYMRAANYSHRDVLERINLFRSSFDEFSKLKVEYSEKQEELNKIEERLNRVIGYENIIKGNYERMVVLEKQENPAVEEELAPQAQMSALSLHRSDQKASSVSSRERRRGGEKSELASRHSSSGERRRGGEKSELVSRPNSGGERRGKGRKVELRWEAPARPSTRGGKNRRREEVKSVSSSDIDD